MSKKQISILVRPLVVQQMGETVNPFQIFVFFHQLGCCFCIIGCSISYDVSNTLDLFFFDCLVYLEYQQVTSRRFSMNNDLQQLIIESIICCRSEKFRMMFFLYFCLVYAQNDTFSHKRVFHIFFFFCIFFLSLFINVEAQGNFIPSFSK